jgi:hypothetical protein
LKELDRNVGETEVDQTDADQTDANPGTDYKDICWQDGRRIIVELKTLAEQLNACDGCDTPLTPTFLSISFKCSEKFFRPRISPFKNGIIRLEAGAFKFLRNLLFMTSKHLF